MARVNCFLLLVAVVVLHGTRGQDDEPSFTNLHEHIKRDLQELIQRALAQSDEKHAAQIATLREENELRIQQVKDELSKKHASDMLALRNEFETQNRDLRRRLEMITNIMEKQENGGVIDHPLNNHRKTQEESLDEGFDNTNRSVDETSENSKKPVQPFIVTQTNPESAPVSQIRREFSGEGRHTVRGSMHQRTTRQVSGETRVAFFAIMEADNVHLGVHHDIIFQNAITNIGNAYNAHHGTFIAPVNGVYFFSCTLYARTKTYGLFIVNGNIVAKFNMDPSTNHQSSHTIIVNLRQGHDVSVQNELSDQTVHGGKYSTFSGFLLHEDITGSPTIVG